MNALPYMSLIINKQNIGYLSSYILLNTMLNLHGFLVASGSTVERSAGLIWLHKLSICCIQGGGCSSSGINYLGMSPIGTKI